MSKGKIEVFTSGCQICTPVVELVRSLINPEYYEIIEYDLVKQCDSKECVIKVDEYQIKRLPAIAVNGRLLNCCANAGITKQDLVQAGITGML